MAYGPTGSRGLGKRGITADAQVSGSSHREDGETEPEALEWPGGGTGPAEPYRVMWLAWRPRISQEGQATPRSHLTAPAAGRQGVCFAQSSEMQVHGASLSAASAATSTEKEPRQCAHST